MLSIVDDGLEENFSKQYPSNTKTSLASMALLIVLGGGQLDSVAVEVDTITKLGALSTECFSASQLSACQRALSLAEVLQRNAALKGHYQLSKRKLQLRHQQ